MAVTIKALIPAKIAESTQTTQYTATGCKAIIDKFTATNYSGSTANLSVNLITVYDTSGNQNLIVKTKSLAAGETYTFPEIVGHYLDVGGYISTLAGTGSAINIRCSGREVT